MVPDSSVPKMTAKLVIMLIVPLALDSFPSATNSGIMPYLAGPKNALWQVNRTNASSVNGSDPK